MQALTAQRLEPDDQIGDLHARVVDVVLHFDPLAETTQAAHQRVAEHRVAQMTDVRRLVRIDVRMFDDDLGRRFLRVGCRSRHTGPHHRGTVEERVDVSRAGGLDARERSTPRECLDESQGDLARRPTQRPSQIEGNRRGKIAQVGGRRIGHRNVRDLDPVRDPCRVAKRGAKVGFGARQIHGLRSSSPRSAAGGGRAL